MQRTWPVILTALAAVLAFIPLTHSVFWGSMAYTLIGGTAVGTVLILLFLPALYAAWFRIKSPGEELNEAKPACFSICFERPKTIGRSMSELNPSRFRLCARFPQSAEIAVSKND